ncbi:MAG: hypothetical protein J7496_06865 [Novosphingobium sp.]|nr:hypothetical protein [Novosphingobium sp.]MBO9602213.1 hypothetical protein [Novosphingobium sp.]
MIDYFAIGLTHGLLALAALRLLSRADLDSDDAGPTAGRKGIGKPWLRNRAPADAEASAEQGFGDA